MNVLQHGGPRHDEALAALAQRDGRLHALAGAENSVRIVELVEDIDGCRAGRRRWRTGNRLRNAPRTRVAAEQLDEGGFRRVDGALIGRDRSVTFSVENVRAEQVCDGTFTNEGPNSGKFSLSCFGGKFSGNGSYERKMGAPNDHIIARGQTSRGQPIVLVIGLPAQLAVNTYGGI